MKDCCILIPYYNSGHELVVSVKSIIMDGFIPDIIIVDDGSTIKASKQLSSIDSSIPLHIIELPINKGIEHALNAGLAFAESKYRYIARLDCGDKCQNSRLKKQFEFMEGNPDCYVVGSWAEFVSMNGTALFTLKTPTGYENIRRKMHVNSMMAHVSVMFRSSIFKLVGFYPTNVPAAEDYALFFKISKNHKVDNIAESLVCCTVDPQGISSIKRKIQIHSRLKIMLDHFNYTPIAFYGVFRSSLLLFTPRSFSLAINRFLRKFS